MRRKKRKSGAKRRRRTRPPERPRPSRRERFRRPFHRKKSRTARVTLRREIEASGPSSNLQSSLPKLITTDGAFEPPSVGEGSTGCPTGGDELFNSLESKMH